VLPGWAEDLDETRKMIDCLLKAYHLHMKESEDAYH